MNEKTILFLLAAAAAALLAAVLYQRFVYVRGMQSRLRQISRKLEEILEADSDEKVMIFTDDRILMELGAQLNRMLTERQRIKAEYKRQEISSKKMLANISHDIKTPLTVLLGYLEMMRLDRGEDKTLEQVEAKAKQVVELINQFFTLAKLEAGDMDISLQKINISELCRENVLEFYEILLQKEFTVDLSIPEETVMAWGDRNAIQRIFYNLISNAIRYGSDGKYLGIALRQDGSCVYIDVADKGKGIESEFAANVFERLYTMEDSRNREIQGNGLGLAIAKNLAVQLGGDIMLKSIPHVKTVFTIKLKK